MVFFYNVSGGNACLQVIPACPQYLKLLQSGRKINIIITLIAYVNIHITPPVVGQAFFGALIFAKVKELPLLPTVVKTCCWATPPSAAGIKLNLSSKKIAVKNACGAVPGGLLPLGCTAFIKPFIPLKLLAMAVALPFTKLPMALPPLMADNRTEHYGEPG